MLKNRDIPFDRIKAPETNGTSTAEDLPRASHAIMNPNLKLVNTAAPFAIHSGQTIAHGIPLGRLAFLLPLRLSEVGTWVEHVPFAFWLVEHFRPSVIVELGVHTGVSYCAFCQAVAAAQLETRCYGIDTFRGDIQAGFYGPEILQNLREFHDLHYRDFSQLIPSTFEAAVGRFEDGSIDLLHIDGSHFYGDVLRDFEIWRRKLSSRAIVLFHDTQETGCGFGVHQLWRELLQNHPAFEFRHGHGLGVLAWGRERNAALESLFAAPSESRESVRSIFSALGARITLLQMEQRLSPQLADQARVSAAQKTESQMRIQNLESEVLSLSSGLEKSKGKISALQLRQIEMKESFIRELSIWRRRLEGTDELRHLLMQREKELRRARSSLERVSRLARRLLQYLDALTIAVRRLYGSKRWRLANPLRSRLVQWIIGSRRPLSYRHIDKVLRTIRDWQDRHSDAIPANLDLNSEKVALEQGERSRLKSRSPIDFATYCDLTTITEVGKRAFSSELKRFSWQPLVSIVLPLYNTPPGWLAAAVDSVRSQIYTNWELIIVDDCSPDEAFQQALQRTAALDSRIVARRLDRNSGISGATNAALELARGEFVGFLDHDDTLEPHALFEVVKLLQKAPGADIIYSDEDKLDVDNARVEPFFKPDWSPDLFLSYNYLCHFLVMRRKLISETGTFRSEFDGAQDYDFLLRATERTAQVFHIPKILYHWRKSEHSTASDINNKSSAANSGVRVLQAALERREIPGHVETGSLTGYRVIRDLAQTRKVSIIIPTRDHVELLSRCIRSIEQFTDYPNYEIIVVDNNSQELRTRRYFARLKHRVILYPKPFNYSAINNFAVGQTDGEWILLLNNDIEVYEPGWLTAMCEHIQRPEVGAVGAKLLYESGAIQHAGVVLGLGGVAGHAFKHMTSNVTDRFGQAQVIRNYSAVTAACLLTRREVFQQVGGFDEQELAVAFNDVDLCIRIRQLGYLIVYTPHATLYHLESATRGFDLDDREVKVMQERWGSLLFRDPYYNPNLTLDREDFGIGVPDWNEAQP